jgi:hypothetical protein
VLRELPDDALQTSLETLRAVKDRIKARSDSRSHIAAK